MHAEDQDVIDDFLLEIARRGLTLRGQFLHHLIREALSGTTAPTEQEIAHLLPQELLRMAKEWKRKPAAVIAALGRKDVK